MSPDQPDHPARLDREVLRERLERFADTLDARTREDDTFYAVDYIRDSLKTDLAALLADQSPRGDSLSVHVPDAYRGALITALATMPDEAFGWFVGWAMTSESIYQFKYPDGLGGFRPESRAAIEQLRAAAKAYVTEQKPPASRVVVEGVYMDRSIVDFQRSCEAHIDEEQRKPLPDTALIALLCDAIRCSRELSKAGTGAPAHERLNLEQVASSAFEAGYHRGKEALRLQVERADYWQRRACGQEESTTGAALPPPPSAPPTEQPEDARGRLLLNSYGRQCYELGYQSGKSAVRAAVPPPAPPAPQEDQ